MGDASQAGSTSTETGSDATGTQAPSSGSQQEQPPSTAPSQQGTNGAANAGKSTSPEKNAKKTAPGMGSPSAAAALAAKAGRIATGATGNLAQGTWDVGKAKVRQGLAAAGDRIGKTIGGQIAAAIKSRDQAGAPGTGASAMEDGSISAGDSTSTDLTAEVAAFRDREPE
ncbi:MAG: hypothetical protein I4O49_09840 [Janthinobacterium lividum]|nr:hypothetical protein [Janthinobacterium lividum]